MNTESIPGHTRAAVLHGALDLRVEEVPVTGPGPGEVLVAVEAVGVCGSDVHYFTDGRNGRNVLRGPMVLGHEPAGVVAALGSGVDGPAVGTRVAVEPAVGCGHCPTCRSGAYHLCPSGTCLGSPPTDGAMSGYRAVPARAAHPLPDTLPTELGALVEPLAVAVHAVRRAGVGTGHRVLVTGAGPIGVLVAQVARAAGAEQVVVTDVHDARLDRAAGLGATGTVNTARDDLPDAAFDRLLECSAVPAALWQGMHALGPAGRATVVGQAPPAVDGLPLALMQRWEIDLNASFRSAHAFGPAIGLAASGRVDLAGVLTGRFALSDAPEALRAPGADPHHLKVVVRPGD
ncbi:MULTISPECIES: NAD(P)-dependent alcohol dehydrogenase [Pseudonocardia]|uniref:Sorbitol dehydrogenase n=2 Tax=Pseudonocardia TaxID=1847 RepID=A0A1Y2N5M7_PSEAH|nr:MULTISPECIES: NAD(P)-dependent alcohol dehydrogenase [Pseudonocardia]OSY42762.1 Sorbitol dehydrogenase [Pseudonocardia autotrophica]TDN77339.1 L-iditol 2-dehydrogenase [Pseudonocardia autotrophica]BBG01361.1 sorbitol dehydrogenase [Pseudonocardia autotrophica]GEC24417.1 sorbitol dehydrogenase [Pseudonocardia saturnea]